MSKEKSFFVGERKIGAGAPCFIVAEISGNHHQNYDEALALLCAAKEAGVDAVKLQTYTPDTLTLNSDKEYFIVGGKDQPDSWKKRSLYDLYGQAYTPWDWQPKLKKAADEMGILLFSSPFDDTAVDMLESIGVEFYKIASYEAVHIPLLRRVAQTGKPVILSIGFASLEEVTRAVDTLRENGAGDIALLHCVTAYSDAPIMEEMRLATIDDIRNRFDVVAGFSDNNAGILAPVISVAYAGASIVEKHIILSRKDGGPDSRFSLEPSEFKDMVDRIRLYEKNNNRSEIIKGIGSEQDVKSAIGEVQYGPASKREAENTLFRPSLWVKKAIKKGDLFSMENVRVARPNHGMSPYLLPEILGKRAACDIDFATPMSLDLIVEGDEQNE